MGPFFCQQEWSRRLLLSLLGLMLQEKRISIIPLVIIMLEESEDRDPGYPTDGREGKGDASVEFVGTRPWLGHHAQDS